MAGPGSATHEMTATEPPGEIQAVPVRHPGRWIAAAVIAVLVAALARSVATNPRFEMGRRRRLPVQQQDPARAGRDARAHRAGDGDRDRARGPAGADADVAERPGERDELGLHLAPSRHACAGADPVLELHLSASIPSIDLGIPFGPSFVHLDANTLITPFMAATLALGLNEGAYMSEIVRAGHHLGRRGPDGRGAGPGNDAAADHAPHRPAPGDAGDHPADRQRDDLDAEDDVARRLHRRGRSALLRRS